jgi:dihydropyrimidinase
MATLIQNGTLILEHGPRRADLLIEGESIAALGPRLAAPPGAERVDAAGLAVLPGFIDFHVHLDDRIGPFEIADSYFSGSMAAVKSGVTTLINFITQRPGQSLAGALSDGLEKGDGRSFCDFTFHLTPTRFDNDTWAEIEMLAYRGYRTFKFYTTYREAGLFVEYERLETILRELGPLGVRALVHCEDEAILEQQRHAGLDPANPRNHALSRPKEAEAEAITKVLASAVETRVPVHIVHVSTPEGIAAIHRARTSGAITCETAPQYLFLNEESLAGPDGHRFICSPPLRREDDRQRLERAALDSRFDLFATDHCPFSREDKDSAPGDYRRTPNGLAGLGALVPLMHDLLVSRGGHGLDELSRRLALNPARLAGLYPRKGVLAPGADADVVLLDARGPERPLRSAFTNVHETYPGRTTRLRFARVYLRGREAVRDGFLLEPCQPSGRSLWPI